MSETTWYNIKMTSNTAPSPYVVSASSIYDASYHSWKAFDGLTGTQNAWRTPNNVAVDQQWLKLDFGEAKIVNVVKISNRNESDYNTATPNSFKIEGSEDNVSYKELTTISEVSWTKRSQAQEFSFVNNYPYRYYRLSVISVPSDNHVTIGELAYGFNTDNTVKALDRMVLKNPTTNQYYSLAEKTIIHLPNTSEQNMINYGIKAGQEIKLDEEFDKIKYPVSDSGTARALIKPLSIKFE